MLTTAHLIGSRTLGGAEGFFLRLIQALQQRGQSTRALLRRGSQVVAAVPRGIPVQELPLRSVWDPLSRWEVSRALRRLGPDIVQTYMGRATRLTHLPPGRGIVHLARLGGYYKLDGYRHAHAWLGNTRGVCDYLIQSGMPARRVFHIYNFIEPPPLRPVPELAALRRQLGVPEEALLLFTAGRFIPVKGHHYLLEALSRLPGEVQGRPLWLALLGEGVLGNELRRRALALGVAGRVVWPGWQRDPAPFYQLADLVVFPSLDRETLGNVILEAWAAGKPLVTAAFRGAREITHHGADAWQVPCGDVAALGQGILTVLGDPQLAAELAAGGARRVRRDFSRDAIVDQYLDLYHYLAR